MTDMNLLRKQYTRITSAGYEPKKAGNRGWVRGKKISNTPVKSEWVDMFYNGQKQGSTYIPVGSMKKRLGKGWTGESTRHSMASYGIKTGTKSQFTPKKVGKKYMLIDNNTKQFLIGYSFDSKKEAESFPEVKKDVAFLKEKKDIVHHFDEFTTSDLQGTVEALAKQYGVDEDELLNEIIVAQHYKTKKLQDEYLDSKEFAKGSAVRKKEMEVFNHG